jgi:hypothetical protein
VSIPARIAKIEEACASNLGFAMRGVSSWDREWLIRHRADTELAFNDRARLAEIEVQVFGESPEIS